MFRYLIAVALCMGGAAPVLAASPAVRTACTGDAIKFCKSVIHDETARHACMKAHASQLSKGCIAAIRAERSAGGADGNAAAAPAPDSVTAPAGTDADAPPPQ